MKLLLLGASGRTGRLVLEEALERGHAVHALVRNRQKIRLSHPLLSFFEGSPLDRELLSLAMEGCEALISTLNISRVSDWPWAKLRTPPDFLSSVMKEVIELAPQQGLERVIVTSAWGAAESRAEIPGWFRWLIEHSNIRFPYEDHARQESLLQLSSLQWTVVRPAGLTPFKKIKPVRVSFGKNPPPRLTISRRNLAGFLLDVLEQHLYLKQKPVVSE